MLDELQLFRGKDYKVNDYMTIHHPTVGEICDYGEMRYFSMVANFCATPSDYKVTLWDDMGLDWEEVDELELFNALSMMYTKEDTSILFGDFPFRDLVMMTNPQNDERILQEVFKYSETMRPFALKKDGVILDRIGYTLMTDFLRKIHQLEKHVERTVTKESKMYLLEKDRRKLKRQMRSKKQQPSVLVPLISSLVNCEQFKYNHTTVWDLPIYTFYDSVRRIQKIKSYDQIVLGGMVDFEKMNKEVFNWMGDLD